MYSNFKSEFGSLWNRVRNGTFSSCGVNLRFLARGKRKPKKLKKAKCDNIKPCCLERKKREKQITVPEVRRKESHNKLK